MWITEQQEQLVFSYHSPPLASGDTKPSEAAVVKFLSVQVKLLMNLTNLLINLFNVFVI